MKTKKGKTSFDEHWRSKQSRTLKPKAIRPSLDGDEPNLVKFFPRRSMWMAFVADFAVEFRWKKKLVSAQAKKKNNCRNKLSNERTESFRISATKSSANVSKMKFVCTFFAIIQLTMRLDRVLPWIILSTGWIVPHTYALLGAHLIASARPQMHHKLCRKTK